jgi:hypothetical protein
VEYAVWNMLHDGSIESITGAVPGDVDLRVGIEYLCEKLPTGADGILIHLRGCRHFEYRPFEGDAVTQLCEIAAADLEVLSAEEVDGTVSVCCARGFLRLVYGKVDCSLAEGEAISQEELQSAAHRYWTEWEEKVQRARG